jgi:twinkle protein
MDAATLVEAGYESATSIPLGAVIKVADGEINPEEDGKFRFVWDAKKQIDAASRIVICCDADGPGQAAAEEIARRIGKDRVWVVEYPDGCKDANDVWLKHGQSGIDDLIGNCIPWPISGLYDSSHFFDQLDDIYANGMGRGETTGYPSLDELYTVSAGMLTIVTGHPSSGKSELVDQIMVNLAKSNGWQFAVSSFENEPRIHIAKLISKYMGKPFFMGPTARMEPEELEIGKEFIRKHFSFIYQADGMMASMDSILERLKAAVMRYGIRGVVIDPYNYIQKPTDVTETDWISVMLTRVRLFAQAHGLHVWFVAHPAKMMRSADGRVPAPKGYDISGSAAWFAKADHGLTVHRPDPAKSVASEVHSWKSRFSWLGKQGQCTLYFNTTTSTYSELSNTAWTVPEGVNDPFADIGSDQTDDGEDDGSNSVPF